MAIFKAKKPETRNASQIQANYRLAPKHGRCTLCSEFDIHTRYCDKHKKTVTNTYVCDCVKHRKPMRRGVK